MNEFQKVIKILAICFGIFIIVNICGAIIFGISVIMNWENKELPVKSFEEIYDSVEKLDIDSSSSRIIIKTGNEFKVEANTKNEFLSKLNNGTLKIKEEQKWFFNNNFSGAITIYLPEKLELKELKIDSGAGVIEIDSVVSDYLDMNHGVGLLKISNSKFDKADIEGGAGKVEITDSVLNNLDFDAGAGKIEIESEITGNSKITAGVGEIDVVLLGEEENYKVTVEKGIGNININNQEFDNNASYGKGENKLDIEGGIGNIDIDFK